MLHGLCTSSSSLFVNSASKRDLCGCSNFPGELHGCCSWSHEDATLALYGAASSNDGCGVLTVHSAQLTQIHVNLDRCPDLPWKELQLRRLVRASDLRMTFARLQQWLHVPCIQHLTARLTQVFGLCQSSPDTCASSADADPSTPALASATHASLARNIMTCAA